MDVLSYCAILLLQNFLMIEYLDNWKFIEFSTWAQNVSDAVYDFYMYKQIDSMHY